MCIHQTTQLQKVQKCEANCDVSKKANPKIYGDFNTTLSVIDTRWKISKDIEKNSSTNKQDRITFIQKLFKFLWKINKDRLYPGT